MNNITRNISRARNRDGSRSSRNTMVIRIRSIIGPNIK